MVNLVKADGDVALFFLNGGGVIGIKNLGDQLMVSGITGTVRFRFAHGATLTFSEGDADEITSLHPADPFSLFHLKPPVRVHDVQYYRDGGTVSFAIVDARGNRLPGGFSRQLQVYPRKFYVGAELYNRSGAKHLEVGGSLEAALVAILQSWLDEELSADDQIFLANYAEYQSLDRERESYQRILQAIEETRPRRLGFSGRDSSYLDPLDIQKE